MRLFRDYFRNNNAGVAFSRLITNVDSTKKEINELKCQERKMLKQTELIKSALNELGCEEVPSGCDLSIDNQTFISNSSEQVSTTGFGGVFSFR